MNRNERRLAAKANRIGKGAAATSPSALCELGFALLKSGQADEADRCCREALAQQSDFPDGLHLMGAISIARQQYDHALQCIAGALRQSPKPEYLRSLGNVLELLGRLGEALQAYDKAVSLRPDDAEIWNSMGFVLTKLDRIDEAVLTFQHVLKLNPLHTAAAHICATLLVDEERFDEAIPYFDLCAKLEPNRAHTFQTRGLCHSKKQRFEQAISDYERALKLEPDHGDTIYNLGHALLNCRRYDDASRYFDRALELDPDREPFLLNKGFAAAERHAFADALAAYSRALANNPNCVIARSNLSMLNLLVGNFAEGWAGREARWEANPSMIRRDLTQPLWLGQQSIADRTILLHSDEGFGDAIQFSRYVPMVAARGARIILEVEKPAYPLLRGMPGVSQSLSRGSPLPEFDYHCPLTSLPLAFQTRLETIPGPVSCLPSIPQALRDQWESWLGPRDRLRVGLVWSGRATHVNDHNRSTTLQTLLPILDLDATFISLQKDPRQQDRITLGERAGVMDANEHLTDFLATAALVSCLDLVITVDTSVAHLAGTLGCPVWIMLPFTPDYRWLLDRDDSPWYPTARLFRQTATRDYAPVVERIKSELKSLIAVRQPGGTANDALAAGGVRSA